ncbi:hypothetical protein BH09MYX1_BH09MYX1_45520 [soil metagenome]
MARRVSFFLVWLALTAEIAGECFGGKWETPLTGISTFIFTAIPGLKFPPWYLAVIATWGWAMSEKSARRGRTPPLITSLRATFASIALLVVWGALRGGDLRQTTWQLHGFLMGFMTGMMLTATCQTAEHFVTLGKVIAAATLYRAMILLIFWFSVGQHLDPPLATQTTHADTALFVTGLLILIANALERRTMRAALIAIVSAIPIAMAIRYNNRRLAWLSLLVGLFLLYLMLPKGKLRRRINMALAIAAPLAIAYVAIGWGRNEGMFRPVGALSTMMGQHEDASSETRNVENYNLVMTLKSNPLLGSGWGHEYEEVSVAYSIKELFAQYRYIPHNSVLGVLAFTGLAGFTGIWQIFPVSTFLVAYSHRNLTDPRLRIAAVSALVALVVFVLQMWGDMGMGTMTSDVLFGSALAVAARVPMLGGVWTKPRVSAKPRVDDENGKDVKDHERAEGHDRPPEPSLPDAFTREPERYRERHDDDTEKKNFGH